MVKHKSSLNEIVFPVCCCYSLEWIQQWAVVAPAVLTVLPSPLATPLRLATVFYCICPSALRFHMNRWTQRYGLHLKKVITANAILHTPRYSFITRTCNSDLTPGSLSRSGKANQIQEGVRKVMVPLILPTLLGLYVFLPGLVLVSTSFPSLCSTIPRFLPYPALTCWWPRDSEGADGVQPGLLAAVTWLCWMACHHLWQPYRNLCCWNSSSSSTRPQ